MTGRWEMGGRRGPSKYFVPEAVYMSADGGEWCIRKMANGFHVIGPYTTDSMGYWPALREAVRILMDMAGPGRWSEWKPEARAYLTGDAT